MVFVVVITQTDLMNYCQELAPKKYPLLKNVFVVKRIIKPLVCSRDYWDSTGSVVNHMVLSDSYYTRIDCVNVPEPVASELGY